MRALNVLLIALVIALMANTLILGGAAIVLHQTRIVSSEQSPPWHLPAWMVVSADGIQTYKPFVVFSLVAGSFLFAAIGYRWACRRDALP